LSQSYKAKGEWDIWMPKDHDIPWFGLGMKYGIEYMIMQEGPNQTWYDFTKESAEWFQAWTEKLRYAYRTFSGNQDDQKNLIKNLLEIQLPRSIQAAGVHPVNPMGRRLLHKCTADERG
jgi:hypothetical protein